MKVLYTTRATATGGRTGQARSGDGALDVTLAMPAELGGDGASGTNPEQLFAAGYAACFLSALKNVASKAKVKLPDTTTVTATVGIGPRDEGPGFGLEVSLGIDIPGMNKDQAEDLVEEAHAVCPYSYALLNETPVRLNVL
ncbi:organic hydroperoxide resistance protein [Paroceanicella profunda]|uniref:Organic hydroperoxide resistance protein n=1 Tax=Paroceanicella profunda TaxID=2579971 RepID=A0A5B8FG60_9RHOB|nr:organic hydroperoxide resistance protein [Paroceanicella profunda]